MHLPIEEVQREADMYRMEALFRAAQANYDLHHPPANRAALPAELQAPQADPPVIPQAIPQDVPQAISQVNPVAEPVDLQAIRERRTEAHRLAVQRYREAEEERIEEEAWEEAYRLAAEEHLKQATERDADYERSAEFWESLELRHFAGPLRDAGSDGHIGGSGQVQSTHHPANTGQNPSVQPQASGNQGGGYQPLIHGHSSRHNYSPLTAALDESYRTGRKVTLKEDPQNDITHLHFVDR